MESQDTRRETVNGRELAVAQELDAARREGLAEEKDLRAIEMRAATRAPAV